MNAPLDIKSYMLEVGRRARDASREVARADTESKNRTLLAAAKAVRRDAKNLLAANAEDVKTARAAGKDAAFIDRLTLTEKTIESMAEGLEQVAKLPDPVGEISELKEQPSGIKVGRMRVPLGVIGIVYESRPNVTADAAALCLKAGNACILRGGSESVRSNLAIAACVHEGLRAASLPEDAVQVVETADRAAVGQLLSMNEYVDIIVPRGGKDLIERVMRESRIPMIKHLDGVCHVYIDDSAAVEKAIRIADNAKTQRYGVCNAKANLPVNEKIAPKVLPRHAKSYARKGGELRGGEKSRALVSGMKPATEEDWYAEYLAPILAVRVVPDLEEAIAHTGRYGSQHTDA